MVCSGWRKGTGFCRPTTIEWAKAHQRTGRAPQQSNFISLQILTGHSRKYSSIHGPSPTSLGIRTCHAFHQRLQARSGSNQHFARPTQQPCRLPPPVAGARQEASPGVQDALLHA